MITWDTFADENTYKDIRYKLLLWVEETGVAKETPYPDGQVPPDPTMGIGFNLRVPANLDEILREMGFNPAIKTGKEGQYIKDIRAAIEARNIQQLHTIMNNWFNDPTVSTHNGKAKRNTFFLSGSESNNEIKNVFNAIAPLYEDTVDAWITKYSLTIDRYSRERTVLMSLAYNSKDENKDGIPDLLGEKLAKAIKAGNRAEAWFEIRYNTNKGDVNGVAKRRFLESEYFGLYNDANNVSIDDARQAYRMLQSHRTKIAEKEALFGIAFDGTAGTRRINGVTVLNAANNDYQASQFFNDGAIDTLEVNLNPAKARIIDWINTTYPTAVEKYGSLDAVKSYNILINPSTNANNNATLDARYFKNGNEIAADNILIGENGKDNLIGGAGHDLLIGGAGDDILEGGKGNDILAGGADNDTYIINVDDGMDTIEDKQGSNKVILCGKILNFFYDKGNYQYTNADGTITAAMNGTDLVVTHVDSGTQVILNEDFEWGDFGINLLDTPTDPTTTLTITGDLAPIDQNPNQEGIQPGEDSLGNIITDPAITEEGRGDFFLDSAGNDRIVAGGGSDIIYQEKGGDDWILGGDGRDGIGIVLGVPSGNDIIEGGAGADLIWGGDGNDRIFAENYDEMEDIIAAGEIAQSIDEQGDLLVGMEGDDFLYGSDRKDGLFGGAGSDLLVGGGGNDIIMSGGFADNIIAYWTQHDNGNGGTYRTFTLGPAFDWSYSIDTDGTYWEPILNNLNAGYDAGVYDETGDDAVYGGTGNDFVYAAGGDDEVYAGDGNDTVFGWGGDDFIEGGDGNDILIGDNNVTALALDKHGDDYIDGGAGNDTIWGGGGSDQAFGGAGNDLIQGDQGDDYLDGEAGDDILLGGAGADELFGGDGNDELHGDGSNVASVDQGNDYLDGEAGNDSLYGYGGDDYLGGGAGNDELYGGDGNDTLYGGDGDDRLEGNQGDDYLDGEAGNNTLYGYTGNDILFGGDGDDRLEGGDGDDYLDGEAGNSTLLGGAGSDTLYGGDGNNQIQAGDGDDYIEGGMGNDTLYGEAGNDTLYGQGGNDWLGGGAGDDIIEVNFGTNTIQGGLGNDTVFGGIDNDWVQGDGGDDVLDGGAGADTMLGGAGMDTISGGDGNNQIQAGDGDDSVFGGSGNDIIYGESGNDTIYGGDGNNQIQGGEGNDSLFGGSGIDTIMGGSGNDNLNGAAGNDVLQGDAGNDLLYGGAGNDTYMFSSGFGEDVIDDLSSPGEENTVLFGSGITLADIVVEEQSDRLIVRVGTSGDVIQLLNFNPADKYGQHAIEKLLFQDGTYITYAELVEIAGKGHAIRGTDYNDTLTGTDLPEYITALGGNDNINAGGGDDIIFGGQGTDTMSGGTGNDIYVVDNTGDVVSELQNEGVDIIRSTVSYTLPDNVENLALEGGAYINGTGNGLDNIVAGNNGSNNLYGNDGNDSVDGGDGNDTIHAGSGNDTIDGGLGNDTMYGGSGNDTFIWGAGMGNDAVRDDAGTDTINFGSLLSTDIEYSISGVDGDNGIFLRNGTTGETLRIMDWLTGDGYKVENFQFADTTLTVAQVYSMAIANGIVGTEGNDSLTVPFGIGTTVYGKGGDDLIVTPSTSTFSYVLYGNDGNDTLYGGSGNDFLDGSSGNDSLYGGSGNDTFIWGAGMGNDAVRDDAGTDTINFGSLLSTDIEYSISGVDGDNGIFLRNGTTGETLRIMDWLTGDGYKVENFQFADTTLTVAQVYSMAIANGIVGTEGNDSLTVPIGIGICTTVYGNGGDDAIAVPFENSFNNVLYGGDGNDTIHAGSGNDTIDGGLGNDTMYGGSGNDTYIWGAGMGDDVLGYDSFGDNVVQCAGLNSADLDYAVSPDQDEGVILRIKSTGETLCIAGWFQCNVNFPDVSNNMRFQFADGELSMSEIAERAMATGLWGTNGNDTIHGPEYYGSHIYGLEGDDILYGGGSHHFGIETLDGGPGNDTMIGGRGGDTYIVDSAQDVIIEQGYSYLDWDQTDSIFSLVSYTLPANVERLYLTGSEALDGTGNDQANTIVGNNANNMLSGGDGNDALIDWYGGNDTLLGGAGNDTLLGGTGNDTLVGGAGNDAYVFSPGDGVDIIVDTATPGEGNTIKFSANGEKEYDPGITLVDIRTRIEGTTLIIEYGDNGDAIYLPDFDPNNQTGPHTVETIEFADYTTVNIAQFINPIRGTEGDDTITAGPSDSVVFGEGGNDIINTSDGADLIDGGPGIDTMAGGNSNDTYFVDNTADVIAENPDSGYDFVYSSTTYTLGANIERLILTGISAINGTGNDLDNYIIGNSANNVLDGGIGYDTLLGGMGDDSYYVDDADVPYEYENEGTDTVFTNAYLMLSSNIENLTLMGTSALNGGGNELDNVINGNSANNILTGYEGNDTLDGKGGSDTMIGGMGDDTYYINSTGDRITENADEGTDTVNSSITYTLGSNIEKLTLTGTSAINGTGNALNNVLTGNSANNTLNGGTGVDTMAGGQGNDTYTVDNAGDVITENMNEGTDTVNSSITYTLGSNIENLTLTGTSAINATGNDLNNYLTGNSANNTLEGCAGNDTMVGGAGNDIYYVNATGDVVTESASAGTDTVNSSITYTLGSNIEKLTLTGTSAINATGNTLNNYLTGNGANNTLDGGTGNDTMVGGAGNDIYYVNATGDVVTESASAGTDTVNSSITYTLGSNIEKLTLTGTSAINATGNTLDNILTGNSANNTLTGGTGNDTLDGGTGNDTMVGGAGNDIYYVNATGDVVTENLNEGADTVNSSVTYTLGSNIEKLTLTGTSAINATGNTLNNYLTGNSADNTLNGGAGNDTYVFSLDSGNDTVSDSGADASTSDEILFGSDVLQGTIALFQSGQNLVIGYGNTDKVTITNQAAADYGVEKIQLNNGLFLTNTDVNLIIQQITAFASSHGITLTNVDNVRANQDLMNIIANAWHA